MNPMKVIRDFLASANDLADCQNAKSYRPGENFRPHGKDLLFIILGNLPLSTLIIN